MTMNDNAELAERAELERLRKATGGLPPEFVAKLLTYGRAATIKVEGTSNVWIDDEIAALRAATFEVTE